MRTWGEAHASLAVVKSQYDWDWAAAEQAYQHALELNPSHATAHQMYGVFLACLSRPSEALQELRRAQELDPLSSSVAATALLPFYYAPPTARRPDLAIEGAKKIIALDPNFPPTHIVLAIAYYQKGLYQDALAAARQARQLNDNWGFTAILAATYATAGQSDEARKLLDELRQREKREQVSAYSLAIIHVALGEKEQAFALLKQACERRDEQLLLLNGDPYLDSLRTDPRFAALTRCIGFPS